VNGWFAKWRWTMVFLTQIVFYGLPWLTWNDRQAVLFDLGARKFFLFGAVFWPQDVIYLAVLLILSALALFLFTAVAGRLWCGYACPQTVYTEIFTWIERKIEGDRLARVLGSKRVMFCANHGVIVVGTTVAEAFDALYYLERACRLQVLARSMGGRFRPVRKEVIEETYRLIQADTPKYAGAHFEALKRILDREEPAYSS